VLFGPSSSSPTISTSELPFPNIRATSEPPPDIELPSTTRTLHARHESVTNNTLRAPMDEYMWEWGAFPQKSPMNPTFDSTNHSEANRVGWKGQVQRSHTQLETFHTSSSLPKEDALSRNCAGRIPEANFGFGGRLQPDREDPYLFTLVIEGRTMHFEISIVSAGRRLAAGSLGGNDEMEDAKIFNDGKLDFWRFIADEQVLNDSNLVLRWGGDR
jgi:phosphatidate phosphatase LPIN